MNPVSLADIIGANAAVALVPNTSPLYAQCVVLTATGGNARLGDANVGAARGAQIVQNVPMILQPSGGDITARFNLQAIHVYVPSGTTLTVMYFA